MKTLLLTIAWLWIAVPLGWGVYQSVRKSLPLFDGASNQVTTTPQAQTSDASR